MHALLHQVPSPLGDSELIFVDNDSTDGTAAILAGAADSIVVIKETRRGASIARNAGLKRSRGGVVALLDADSVPGRTWLREISAPFADPEVIVVAGGTASFPPRTAAQRFASAYGLTDATRAVNDPVIPYANTRNMAIRRDTALAIGGFAEDLPSLEDVEFGLRLKQKVGCRIDYRDTAFAFHDDRDDDESLWRQAFLYGRGTAVMYARYPDLLPWGLRQRVRRTQRAAARRIGARLSGVRERLGLMDAAASEYARYLARWDQAFWDGFEFAKREQAEAA